MDNENNNFNDFDEIEYKRKFDLLENIQDYIEEGFIPIENIGMNSSIMTLEFELALLKKKHVLSQLNKLKEMGILLSKEYTIDDNYYEMNYELKYRKMLKNSKNTAKILKEVIPAIGTLMEISTKMLGLDNINGKKLDLTGLGDHIKERVLIGDYDKSINKVAKNMVKHDDIIEKDPTFMLIKEVVTDFSSIVFINSIKENNNENNKDDNSINNDSDSIDYESDNISIVDSLKQTEKEENNSINSNDSGNINNIFNETNKFNKTMTFDEAKKVFSKTFNKNLEELSIDSDIDLTIIEENERIDKMMKL